MERIFWHPMREFAETQKHFSHFFNDKLRQEVRPQASWTPAVDVYETANGYEFSAELPGLRPEAVEVEVKNNTLTIKGERQQMKLQEGDRCLHRERPYGRFARVFRLSKPVNAEGVTATYKDGILAVTVPFRGEAKPRKIVVQG